MIAIDASSLAKYILREKNWKEVRGYLLNDPHSLTLALAEVSNAIWKHHVLYGVVSDKEAEIMFKALKRLKEDVVIFEPFESYLEDAMRISIKERIPIYDALYLSQAKKYDSLLTSDERQWEIAKKLGIKAEYVG
ncbi:type II toxin-antitoxin system VapC family toxin [Thermococcus aggregans]|uniref:Type II toxin-antitoxin system VapC family toxin n=1 Tax=Thermococcus aggregans TaxID=110163 RepID=A0A9E7SPL8_THEAG|nr:type II toxin-antitoxin system VapC family toxin [Thermococcus aggregans]USS41037.1 type II toxin-antitoxin system VapC family toxin [Thermococcus aggregans]